MYTYWTFTSTPYTGWESKLWSSWMDVIDVKQDLFVNGDKEILFNTYSDADIMGKLLLESKMEIEDAKDLIFRGRFGCKYSYPQVKTVGYVEIYDLTAQSSVWRRNIQTNGFANSWNWVSFSSPGNLGSILSLSPYHDYVIRLFAKDAWAQQKVQIAWESAEPWFYSPYYRTLVEYDHDWYGSDYRCYMKSDYYFRQGPIDDMLRNHLPYVNGGGFPWGWNPCYIHEFRSEPYTALEYDQWYSTTMPGVVGHTWSSLGEQQDDEFDEVEIYTRNPEQFTAYYIYNSRIRYNVLETGYVDFTLEAELGNENDWAAWGSPPAMPIAWLEIEDETVYHSQSSTGLLFSQQGFTTLATEDIQTIEIVKHYDWYDVIVSGVYPYYLQVYTRINIDSLKSESALETLLTDMESRVYTDAEIVEDKHTIPVKITFNSVTDVNRALEVISKYDLSVDSFGFTANNGKNLLRGQGTPSETEIIPLNELETFIGDFDFVGIHSIDVNLDPAILEGLINDDSVAIVNFLAFKTLTDAGLSLELFDEVQWMTEDPSWYLNHVSMV